MSTRHVWTAVSVSLAVLGFSAPSLTQANTSPVTHASRIAGLLRELQWHGSEGHDRQISTKDALNGQCTVTGDGPQKTVVWETENR